MRIERSPFTFGASQIDPVLAGTYESITVYANVITDLLEESKDLSDAETIVKRISNSSYRGVRGDIIWMGADGQRDRNYQLKYFNNITEDFEVTVLEKIQELISISTFFRCLFSISNIQAPTKPFAGCDNQLGPEVENCRRISRFVDFEMTSVNLRGFHRESWQWQPSYPLLLSLDW